MKMIIHKLWLAIAGGVLLAACSSSAPPPPAISARATQLFTLEPTPDRATLQKTATGHLATLLADPANQEITWVNIDPAVVSASTQTLAITLPDGKVAQFHLRDFTTIVPGIEGWVGYIPSAWKKAHPESASEIDNDPFFYLSLAREGEALVGTLTVEGQRYRIDYLSPGRHALIKLDESKLPAESDPVGLQGVAARAGVTEKTPRSAHSTIRVMFFTTNERRKKTPTYRAQLAQGVNDANQYMKNTQVPITFELVGILDPDYDEGSKTGGEQFRDFRMPGRDLNTYVVASRNNYSAAFVSLYTSYAKTGGEAAGGGYSIVGDSRVIAHEFGHHLGAAHGWSGNPSAGYNHGYEHSDPTFHTLMVTTWRAIPYFSNPRLTYQGFPLGTVEHHDVARRFNETREAAEASYPPVPRDVIINVNRYEKGLPACLQPADDGRLGFGSCLGQAGTKRLWRRVGHAIQNIEVSEAGNSDACLRFINGRPGAVLGACGSNTPPYFGKVWSTQRAGTNTYQLITSYLANDYCLRATQGNDNVDYSRCSSAETEEQWVWNSLP